MHYLKGKKVDPADVTADGERFENIDQLKKVLLRDKPRLARALTTKLIAYSTGRAPQASAIARLARPQSSSVSCGHPKGLDYNTGICSASPLPSLSWAWLV